MNRLHSAIFVLAFYTGLAIVLVSTFPLFISRRGTVWALRMCGHWVMFCFKFFSGCTYEIRGLEKLPQDRAFMIASQHQSTWETFLFHHLLSDPVYIIKRELYFIPFAGWYGWRTGQIGINRQKGGKVLDQMIEKAKKIIVPGRPLVIFPEGTRVAEGKHVPLKKGVGLLYKALDVPLVPVVLTSGLFWHKFRIKRRGKLIVEFLDPIEPGLKASAVVEKLESLYAENYGRIKEESLKDAKVL